MFEIIFLAIATKTNASGYTIRNPINQFCIHCVKNPSENPIILQVLNPLRQKLKGVATRNTNRKGNTALFLIFIISSLEHP